MTVFSIVLFQLEQSYILALDFFFFLINAQESSGAMKRFILIVENVN